GSVFDIYLPVTAAAPSIAHAAPARIPHGAGELVLVVDDDPAICELTETILRLHGYRALTATNGHEAETIYREKHDDIAVIVTDCSMPGMTGLELVRTIRSHNPQTRFILASGAEPCLEKNLGGPVAFLHKPWTAVEFLSLLRDVLKKPEASP
ncbi:MAG: response regulator, partial [Verrucomicrobiota bacterium]